MSSCSSGGSTSFALVCPQCGISCKNISMKTIFHQVRFPEILDIETGSYYYCADKSCSVGYFSQEEKVIFKNQLKIFTELKNNKLCYCFDINTEQYVDSLKDGTAETIKNFVIQKTKVGDCACEIRNPSGQCCLANFKQLEKTLNLDK
ncbi:conserved hypothetical protein [Bathymodiolus platifrons methanotrophic gill symbiont]|uniref:putative iron-sulfur cluster-binding metallochaperone n=1 Tax=Bathymodiolus platifrons methanotrophic gill symbiont TaxID=113268 RepID=UPI000B680187|nr:hypothetical protein [Bathymodiolus platifrons methanotrophic gill symbiont]GAW86111.1 conserved hypothetical protein [Bathymodiolus platifrons methanotrophic gill symbiont]